MRFNDVIADWHDRHIRNAVRKNPKIKNPCFEFLCKKGLLRALLTCRHKPFLLVNNSIIQNVYFDAFCYYSRNFRAIKSSSGIYCGSAFSPGGHVCTGENKRCRKVLIIPFSFSSKLWCLKHTHASFTTILKFKKGNIKKNFFN